MAVGFENVAPLQDKDSFTAALTKILIDCQKNNNSLYASRLSTMLNADLRLGERQEQNEHRIRRTPHHLDFHGTKAKIWIGAIERPKEDRGAEYRAPKSTLMPDLPVVSPQKPSFIRLFQPHLITKSETTRIYGDLVKYGRFTCLPKMNFNALWVMDTEKESTRKLMVNSLEEEQCAPWATKAGASLFDYSRFQMAEEHPTSASDIPSLPAAEKDYKEMRIQPSLHKSLERLFRSPRALDTLQPRIWMYDLCVMKDSPAGKSGQARLTPEIFGKAVNFIISGWLDVTTKEMGELLDFIHRLNEDPHLIDRVVKPQGTSLTPIAWLNTDPQPADRIANTQARDMEEIDSLFTVKSYWKRLVDLLEASPFQYRRAFVGLILCKSCQLHVSNSKKFAFAKLVDSSDSRMIDSQAFFGAVILLGSRYEQLILRTRQENPELHEYLLSEGLTDMRELMAYKALLAVNSFRLRTRALDLETLVCQIPTLRVSDPRDIIYDFIPLAIGCEAWRIDYTAPVADIYQDFVRYCVTQSKSMDIICRPWAPRDAEYGLANMPSWICPVKDTQETAHGPSPHIFVGMPGKCSYKVSRDSKAVAVFRYVGPTAFMTCSGFVVRCIGALFDVSRNGILPARWLPNNTLWATGTGSKPESELWRVLVADRGPDGTPAPRWYQKAYSYWEDQYLYDFGSHRSHEEVDDVWAKHYQRTPPPSTALEYKKHAQTVIRDRRLFYTDTRSTGYFDLDVTYSTRMSDVKLPVHGSSAADFVDVYGLCPEQTQSNDLVCVLYGCSVPVILRRESGGAYRLIGECFALNMMDGEAMEMRERDHSEEFDIF